MNEDRLPLRGMSVRIQTGCNLRHVLQRHAYVDYWMNSQPDYDSNGHCPKCKPTGTLHCAGQYRPVQASTDQYRPVQASTGQYRPVQTSTDHCRPLQTSTDQYKPVQTSTDQYRPVQASTDQYRPVQASTGQYRPPEGGLRGELHS